MSIDINGIKKHQNQLFGHIKKKKKDEYCVQETRSKATDQVFQILEMETESSIFINTKCENYGLEIIVQNNLINVPVPESPFFQQTFPYSNKNAIHY